MTSLVDSTQMLSGVARKAIKAHLDGISVDDLFDPSAESAPVFVTLRTSNGELRGCIGTLESTTSDVVAETARNAVLAAVQDPRFPPVAREELDSLRIEVSILMPQEVVPDASQLDPLRYGVIVRGESGRHGVLLPNIEGVDTAEEQITIACRKADIADGESIVLSRFEVLKAFESQG
jgi:AmmeMemoRadiSam system protein A